MSETLTVGEHRLEVRRSSRRRNLSLIVDRDGSLVLAAPANLDHRHMVSFVHEKRSWLEQKLRRKDELRRTMPVHQYVDGESFLYLGRNHRLQLVDEQEDPLKLQSGRFRLRREEATSGRRHFVEWYTRHARTWLQRRVDDYAPWVGATPNGIRVLELGNRWGSCGAAGQLNFHWASILLPPSVVEYVVVHELTHLLEPNHTPTFWRRVGAVLPDYEQRLAWLNENGARAAAL